MRRRGREERSVEHLKFFAPFLYFDVSVFRGESKGETMSEAGKAVMDALMRGMEIEKETFDFYTRAEQKTFNPEGKRVFRWLAKSEESHYLKLTELYKSLDQGGRWVFFGGQTITLEPQGEEAGVGFETSDIEALKLALEVEKKGIAYFDELLTQTTDPEGRSMIQSLRAEEEEHIRVISEKLRLLEAK
jgi:rubrerythrin